MSLQPTRQLKKLSELGIFIRGVSYKKPELLQAYQSGCVTLLRANNIQGNKLDLSEVQFLPKGYTKVEQITKENDILFCMSSGSSHLVGKNVTLPELNNFSFGAFCSIFRTTHKLCDFNYLSHYLQGNVYFEYITNISRGAGINNLRNSDLEEFQIPIPPLPTQHAIVAKLDAVQDQISEAKQSVQSQLDALDTLWQSSLSEVFENQKYELVKLGDIFNEPKKAEIKDINDQENCSFVPMVDMNQEMMYFDTKQIKKIGEVRKGYTYFAEHDVLLAKVTPCFENGKSGIAKNLINGIGFGSSEYYVLRPDKKILPQILYYLISSKKFRIEGAKNMGGAVGLQRVKKERINNFEFYLPSLTEQESIIARLDALDSQLSALRTEYKQQLQNYDAFWASTLDKAFKGELVE